MENDRKPFILITYGVLLYLIVRNLTSVLSVLGEILSVFTPLIIGIGIAFVLNLLMSIIENKLLTRKIVEKNLKFISKNKRPFSLLLTYFITIVAVVMIILFIVPQVIESSKLLISKLPEYGQKITQIGTELYYDLGLSEEMLTELFGNFKNLFVGLSEFTANTLLKLLTMTLSITSGALNLLLGLVFSIYLLAQKEKLIEILSKVNRAFNKKRVAIYLQELGKESSFIFSKFVGGQITEAIILGSLCFIGLLIFGVPYAPLVSVLIALTSLVPVVGAFIGTIPSFLIIAMESPTKAVIFLIFILILQQLEGNIIYPKVVGDAIGIGGFWVFLAITVGGGLFGIMGMLMGVPLMAILYSVVKKEVDRRLKAS